MEMKQIVINKNRGWRGLAEVHILNEKADIIASHIFSFSQNMWDDMIFKHTIVVADQTYYYVIKFNDDHSALPRIDQQRSVLIKNFLGNIEKVTKYEKASWTSASAEDYNVMLHFIKNKNNHTTSDWNCIGLRVIPGI